MRMLIRLGVMPLRSFCRGGQCSRRPLRADERRTQSFQLASRGQLPTAECRPPASTWRPTATAPTPRREQRGCPRSRRFSISTRQASCSGVLGACPCFAAGSTSTRIECVGDRRQRTRPRREARRWSAAAGAAARGGAAPATRTSWPAKACVQVQSYGKLLLALGKPGVTGNGPDVFIQPGRFVAPNGDIFVADGHTPTTMSRIVNSTRPASSSRAGTHGPGSTNCKITPAMTATASSRCTNNRAGVRSDGSCLRWAQFAG